MHHFVPAERSCDVPPGAAHARLSRINVAKATRNVRADPRRVSPRIRNKIALDVFRPAWDAKLSAIGAI
jgi:hypothetical protein